MSEQAVHGGPVGAVRAPAGAVGEVRAVAGAGPVTAIVKC